MRTTIVGVVVGVAMATAGPARADRSNLLIDVSCADYWATPGQGLQVSIDGVARPGLVQGEVVTGYTADQGEFTSWVPTQVAFVAPYGPHDVTIAAPDCAAVTEHVQLDLMPTTISGRLAITEPSLQGAAGAPNGLSFAISGYLMARAAHGDVSDAFQTSSAFDGSTVKGGTFTMAYVHRHFYGALDMTVGAASVSGTVTSTDAFDGGGTATFWGTAIQMGQAIRVGARWPFGDFAVMAGTGIGGDLFLYDTTTTGNDEVSPPAGVEDDWYVPVWATAMYKTSCDWGVEVTARYDYHVSSPSESEPSVSAGFAWEPSSSCRQAPGLIVH